VARAEGKIRNPNIEILHRTPYGGNKFQILMTKIPNKQGEMEGFG
jgi:hypothetical protein